ncbi:MAG TPA: hypothetical protein VH370_15975 [Humisphaera sp.]|nr:hypothetical protein [Humisphaera sp.]
MHTVFLPIAKSNGSCASFRAAPSVYCGPRWAGSRPSRGADGTEIWFPHWVVVLAFSALPAVRLISFVPRRKRFSAGHSSSCGYHLRATPARSPECGATPGAVR